MLEMLIRKSSDPIQENVGSGGLGGREEGRMWKVSMIAFVRSLEEDLRSAGLEGREDGGTSEVSMIGFGRGASFK